LAALSLLNAQGTFTTLTADVASWLDSNVLWRQIKFGSFLPVACEQLVNCNSQALGDGKEFIIGNIPGPVLDPGNGPLIQGYTTAVHTLGQIGLRKRRRLRKSRQADLLASDILVS